MFLINFLSIRGWEALVSKGKEHVTNAFHPLSKSWGKDYGVLIQCLYLLSRGWLLKGPVIPYTVELVLTVE